MLRESINKVEILQEKLKKIEEDSNRASDVLEQEDDILYVDLLSELKLNNFGSLEKSNTIENDIATKIIDSVAGSYIGNICTIKRPEFI
jgi:hypothetical protein